MIFTKRHGSVLGKGVHVNFSETLQMEPMCACVYIQGAIRKSQYRYSDPFTIGNRDTDRIANTKVPHVRSNLFFR